MIACQNPKTQVLVEASAWCKLARLDENLHTLLLSEASSVSPETPGRDVQIWAMRDLPPKPGLSTREGQARLLHDLASIELQAMELGLRTLLEFPEAPREFREELAEITRQEGLHLRLCLEGLEDLERPWGSFPAHLGLWQSVGTEDTLLDRVLIVHRYLEGSGLDASDTLLRRLSGVDAKSATRAVRRIREDEVGHVQFGSAWYVKLARAAGLDPEIDFGQRLGRVFHRVPRRLEPIRRELREKAGFTPGELETLEEFRQRWLRKDGPIHAHAHGAGDKLALASK